ncbi:hypothetical protein AHF37_06794 [Paragonimus kellicotti]|nr:hypothetical protein AHF37_06794 [Paragonimus kellicotti]
MKVKELERFCCTAWSPESCDRIYMAAITAEEEDSDPDMNAVDTHLAPTLELFQLNLQDPSLDMQPTLTVEVKHSQIFGTGMSQGFSWHYMTVTQVQVFSDPNLPFLCILISCSDTWTQPIEPISKVAWNPRVQHILATAAAGHCTIWDLRRSDPVVHLTKAMCQFEPHLMVWSPDVATRLCLADPAHPSADVQLWDLRYPKHALALLARWPPSSSGPLGQAALGNAGTINAMAWSPNLVAVYLTASGALPTVEGGCGTGLEPTSADFLVIWSVEEALRSVQTDSAAVPTSRQPLFVGRLEDGGSEMTQTAASLNGIPSNASVHWLPTQPGLLSVTQSDGWVNVINLCAGVDPTTSVRSGRTLQTMQSAHISRARHASHKFEPHLMVWSPDVATRLCLADPAHPSADVQLWDLRYPKHALALLARWPPSSSGPLGQAALGNAGTINAMAWSPSAFSPTRSRIGKFASQLNDSDLVAVYLTASGALPTVEGGCGTGLEPTSADFLVIWSVEEALRSVQTDSAAVPTSRQPLFVGRLEDGGSEMTQTAASLNGIPSNASVHWLPTQPGLLSVTQSDGWVNVINLCAGVDPTTSVRSGRTLQTMQSAHISRARHASHKVAEAFGEEVDLSSSSTPALSGSHAESVIQATTNGQITDGVHLDWDYGMDAKTHTRKFKSFPHLPQPLPRLRLAPRWMKVPCGANFAQRLRQLYPPRL